MKDLAFMVKKLERKQRDSYQFKNTGIAKQAEFLQQVGDWLEDSLKTKLEKEMGRVPTGLQKVITAGESLIAERLHLLKIADTYGWSAVTEFISTELARSEAEEKKLKKIAKANEAKLEKVRGRKSGKEDQDQGRYTSGAGGGTRKAGDEGRGREDRECYNCKKVGHISINCRVKDGKGAGSGRRVR